MAEKEFTKKITAVIKEVDKAVQAGEKAIQTLKELTRPKKSDKDETER